LSRYLAARAAKVTFVEYLRDDPWALKVLIELLGSSPFLTEILVRNPEYFHWLTAELGEADSRVPADEEVDAWLGATEGGARLDGLKRLKRRHILKIAARDILLQEPLPVV